MKKKDHKSQLTSIEQLLGSTFKDLNIEKNYAVFGLLKQWEKIMGPLIGSKTRPQYLKGNTLIIEVENPVWMNELNHQKKQLLTKLSSISLQREVKDIHFRLKKELY